MESDQIKFVAIKVVERLDAGGELVHARPLAGGVSAQVFRIEFKGGSSENRTVVLRQHGHRDLARNPDIARDEFRLLSALHERGIAVPAPIFFDDSGRILSSPYLVVEFIDGATSPCDVPVETQIDQIATQLAAIHAVFSHEAELRSLPNQNEAYLNRLGNRPHGVANDMLEDAARAAMQHRGTLAHHNQPVLLHGDYWPGNVLWRDGKIAAVIDWEDAAIGDPLADLANCRMELLFAFGAVAMDAFTRRYVDIAPLDLSELPYWDLFAATGPVLQMHEWDLAPNVERSMRERHGEFVRQALQRIAANDVRP